MREDMYKVIVERPRRGKNGYATAARLRNDLDGPQWLSTRAGYGYRDLNENLAPLRRFLRSQIGRPWDKVFSEICSGIDRRNTVQQHIHQHIHHFIAVDVGVSDGQWVDLADRERFLCNRSGIRQELFVDPRSGLIRVNRDYRSWRRSLAERRQRVQTEIAARRRVLDARNLLLLIDDVWFRVEVDELPNKYYVVKTIEGKAHKHAMAKARYDVVLRKKISRTMSEELRQCKYLYGSEDVYAVSKRQLSTHEKKAHGLYA